MSDLRNLPIVCSYHLGQLGEIHQSELADEVKEGAFNETVQETSDRLWCTRLRIAQEQRPPTYKLEVALMGIWGQPGSAEPSRKAV